MADDANPAPPAGPGANIPDHVPPELFVDFDVALWPTTSDDPYAPAREALAALPPVFYAPSRSVTASTPGAWVVRSMEDVREVYQNGERYSTQGIFQFQRLVGESFPALPLSVDPPEHDRYRMLLNPWFSPKAVSALESQMYAIVNALIDGFADKGEVDVAYDFGRVYPVKVFMGLMGFPDEMFEEFLSWGYAMLHDSRNLERVQWGARSALKYLRSFVEEMRRDPRDNLTAKIVHAQVDGRPLTDPEIMGIMFFLWTGGLDTVAATTALMFRRLALDPALQKSVRADLSPGALTEVIEEFLRTSPTVNSARVAKVDHEIHGVKVKAGERVVCMIAAANFDPAEFEDPLAFHADRATNRHVTFVAGPHRCLGSHLARRELRIALGEFLRRVPTFRMKDGADRTAVPGLIAMPHLPLVWDVG